MTGEPDRRKSPSLSIEDFIIEGPNQGGTRQPHRRSFARRMGVKMLVGLLILFAGIPLHAIPPVVHLEEALIDAMMAHIPNAAYPVRAEPGRPSYLVVDIDDESRRAWGGGVTTPPGKLLELIRTAVDRGAGAVVVNLFLDPMVGPQDGGLGSFLTNYKGPVPILLTRQFDQFKEESPKEDRIEPRPSAMDDAVARSTSVRWVSSWFVMDSGGRLRRWTLWMPVCALDAPYAVPSTQLAVALHLAKGNGAKAGAVLRHSAELACRPAHSDAHNAAHGGNDLGGDDGTVDIGGGKTLRLSRDDWPVTRQIVYSLPEYSEGGWAAAGHNDRAESRLEKVPAAHLLAGTPSDSLIGGRVVVIGTSGAEQKTFATPQGVMSGSFVIVNSIETLARLGRLEPTPMQELLLECGLIVVLAGLYSWLRPGIFVNVLSVLLMLGILWLSIFQFMSGQWLNTIAPVLGIWLHGKIERIEDDLHGRKKKREHSP